MQPNPHFLEAVKAALPDPAVVKLVVVSEGIAEYETSRSRSAVLARISGELACHIEAGIASSSVPVSGSLSSAGSTSRA